MDTEGNSVLTDAPRLLGASRRAAVLSAVAARGTIRLADLAAELGVTPVTVRRDVAELAQAGLVTRVHGGVMVPDAARAVTSMHAGVNPANPVNPVNAGTPAAAGTEVNTGTGGEAGRWPTGRASSLSGAASSPSSSTSSSVPSRSAPSANSAASAPSAARAATTEHAGAIGMLVPSLDYYWPGVARGAEEESAAHHLRLVLRGSAYDAADETGDVERLLDSGVRGLLLAPTMRGEAGERIRAWLAAASVPHVLMERSAVVGPERRAVESVVSDHALGAGMAVHHLASIGHRRIGIALSHDSPHLPQIRAGWASARAELGLDLDTPDLSMVDARSPSFLAALDEVLDTVERTATTALLVHSDPEAIRLVQRAQERGLTVPGDLSVVTYDDEVATLATPALTAVRPPRRTIGRTAVTLLSARLADPGRPIHRVMVSPTLYVRASTGPPALRGLSQ